MGRFESMDNRSRAAQKWFAKRDVPAKTDAQNSEHRDKSPRKGQSLQIANEI